MKLSLAALAGMGALLLARSVQAATLISDLGYAFPPGVTPNPGVFSPNLLKAMDFTLAQSANNVAIAANVGSLPGHTPGTMKVYLTQAIGSSASAAANHSESCRR